MNKKIICGIQQIGIGVPDVETAWKWYRQFFGMDVPVFQDAAEAPYMTRYTGGVVQSRTATLAINLTGGGGFEVWQYTSRTPEPPSFQIQVGDLGIFCPRIKSRDVHQAFEKHRRMAEGQTLQLLEDPSGSPHYFIRDSYGNLFQVVEGKDWFTKEKKTTGGPAGCMIGVSDIEKARSLYSDILGYDSPVYDEEDSFDDFALLPGGEKKCRRVLLNHSEPRKGSFSRIFGSTSIELVQVKNRAAKQVFADRFWGDLGYIHLCFDVKHMDSLKEECEAKGFPFTADSNDAFDMGQASGRFSYIEDPDGTLIEFVETNKIPIMKNIGWYFDVGKRDPEKPLPDFLLKMLGLGRVKD